MKVLICGGGIAGLTLAHCLALKEHEVLIVEQSPSVRGEGYMIDFFGSGYDASSKLGLLPELEKIHYPISHLTFVDERGRERISLSYEVVRKRLFDDRHYNFLRGDLERVLYERAAQHTEIRFGTTIDAVETDADIARVRLSDGSAHEFALVVGADGVHSHIRRLIFGEEEKFVRPLGYRTLAFILEGSLPAALRDSASFVTLTVPRKQASIYPIRDQRLATFFLHRTEQPIADFSREFAIRELRTVYGNLRWIVPELVERAAHCPNVYFDTVTQIELPRWSVGRVALLGDACQCVSLLAGQGASMAVASAYVLAEELDHSRDNIPTALALYEERLKPAIVSKQAAGRRIANWFVPKDSFGIAMRDFGLRVSSWPFISSIFRRKIASESIFRAG